MGHREGASIPYPKGVFKAFLTHGREPFGKEPSHYQAGQDQGEHRPALNLGLGYKGASMNPCTVAAPANRPVAQALNSKQACSEMEVAIYV